jgi:hypothetical protein
VALAIPTDALAFFHTTRIVISLSIPLTKTTLAMKHLAEALTMSAVGVGVGRVPHAALLNRATVNAPSILPSMNLLRKIIFLLSPIAVPRRFLMIPAAVLESIPRTMSWRTFLIFVAMN